ncbi:MAG: hypothetical protein R6U67_03780 [Sodalinema sp.]|uniref:hypothetical protein n=1 Tax=Sodalinema sp. TaxID=3080550 RepID=UPI001215AAFC|nr:MAG: hypothetical protein EYR95_13135 [Phormidium sp. SL48-SHIP]
MLYFQHNRPPEADSDAIAPSLQGLITEDDEGTLVLLDWVFEPTDSQATPRRHESIWFRVPHLEAASPPTPVHPSPPQGADGSVIEVSVSPSVTDQRPDQEPDCGEATPLSLGLAVGLGVNLLALLGGAYLLQATVSPSAIAQWDSIQPVQEADSTPEQQQLDGQARSWIELAQHRAQHQDFRGAIIALEQIPPGSTYYHRLQPKLREYRQKREIRANWLLQQAYNAAANRDFTEALGYLRMIPPGTEARDRALEKLAQYQEQKTIHATWLLQQAYNQAAGGQFPEAIAYLQRIPEGTPVYGTAQVKLAEYRLKAQTQANLDEISAIAPPEQS